MTASRSTAASGGITRPRSVRGRGSRLQQPVGHRLRRKGQLLISACVIPHLARHPGRHLSATGWPALQPVCLQRHSDDRRSSSSVGARRRPRLSIRCLSDSQQGRLFMANIHEHAVLSDVLTRKGPGSPLVTARTSCSQTTPSGWVQPGDRAGGRAIRPRLARRGHLRR